MATMNEQTNNNGLCYVSAGQKGTHSTVLICVHGWGCRGSDYDLLFEQLKQRSAPFGCVAVDLPGHGSSPKSICPKPSVADFATVILESARQTKCSNIYLAGHSMGTRIILEAWQQSKGVQDPFIKGLIFLDGSSYAIRSSSGSNEKSLTEREKTIRRMEFLQSGFSEYTPPEFEMTFLDHLGSRDRRYIEELRENFVAYDHTDVDRFLTELGADGVPLLNLQSTDVIEDNARLRLKEGQSSKWMGMIREKVPKVEQHVVTRSAHFPHIDQPEKVADLVVAFIEAHSR